MSFGIPPNKEYPRASDLKQVDCSSGITVSCDAENCNVIVLTDAEGNEKRLFSAIVSVRAVQKVEDCSPADYRREQEAFNPHVVIYGKDADNTENYFKDFVYTVYPEDGISAKDLAQEINDAICLCVNPPVPEPEPVVFPVYNEFLFEQSNQNVAVSGATNLVPTTNLPPIEKAGIYKVEWSIVAITAADAGITGNISFDFDSSGIYNPEFNIEQGSLTDARSGSKYVNLAVGDELEFGWLVNKTGAGLSINIKDYQLTLQLVSEDQI